ncbi:MAG TPA: hypothetical protein PLO51_02650 [Candidatus Micrarchaeota archaeon]|nr:hypothetical protein [Candidatus Micrarchaeota archaeon]
MRLVILAIAAILLFSIFGCAGQQAYNQQNEGAGAQNQTLPANGTLQGNSNAGAGGVAGGDAGLAFNEWKAPDGSITLKVPAGWQASEVRVDNCTVNWAVLDPSGTKSAYMDNEIMVFKSENAKQMYEAYGLAGAGNAPISGYLGAQGAVQKIIAPLTGASNVHVTYIDLATGSTLSRALCSGLLAACDAQAFEAAYQRNGTLMRGEYMALAYDFGDGTTWWINIWGYTSPAAEWDSSSPALEKIFASAKYTDEWVARCGAGAANASSVINDVIISRQASADKAAQAWDNYMLEG